ncbi:hypothetical protein KGG72_gp51 [Streptomyces phage Salutena]|uniref:Uncharacterized protein n=1 Tax=Streptomyces phage Salutena TaxID=2767576 RepID=A0A7S6U331_9CAUD|nr:hypothetical protein KGG72_gp51 [Streptomyces phage Salutena]QOV06181.1 hypothetical protein CPT_Salutena_051 [Streptomyces phage Salutena]
MSNGWDWIEEGQRIAEESRRAGEVDVEAIKAESLVFDSPTLTLKTVAPQPAGFVDEVHALKNEVDICRAGHCDSGYKAVRLGDEVKRLRAALNEALTILGEV